MNVISDRASTKKWIWEKPQVFSLALASRASLRMLPELGNKFGMSHRTYDRRLAPLAAMRCLISALAVCYRTSIRQRFAASSAAKFAAEKGHDDPVEDAMFTAQSAAGGQQSRNFAYDAINAELFIPTERWNENIADINVLSGPDVISVFDHRLWRTFPTELKNGQSSFVEDILSASSFAFWREWYQGFLDGKPLDWELQRRVALIEDAIWEAGPKAVAEEIEKIRAKFDAEQAVRPVAEHLSTRVAATEPQPINPMIGHNMPPPDEQLPVAPHVLMVHVQTIQQELASETPNFQTIELATQEIEQAEEKLQSEAARRVGLSADEFAKQFGKHGATAVWAGVTAGTLWLFQLLEHLGPMLQALRRMLAMLMG